MKKTINLDEFRETFRAYNRCENFSYEALELLFDYFEELDESCGMETELDVIGICCEYSEMTKSELLQSYDLESLCPNLNIDWFNVLDNEEQFKILQDGLIENTSFVGKTEPHKGYSYLKEPTFVFCSAF